MEYPRALPFNPPRKEITPHWRFWPHVALLLALVIAAEYWILRGQAALPASLHPEPALEKEERIKPALNVAASAAEKAQPEKGKPAATLADNKLLLETLGAWGASQVYQSYLNIGMLADAVAHQAYAEGEAYAILATLNGLLQMMDRQLEKVATVIATEDQAALANIRRLNRLLQTQGDALVISWETGDRKKEEEYLQIRGKSWDGIQEVLGVE